MALTAAAKERKRVYLREYYLKNRATLRAKGREYYRTNRVAMIRAQGTWAKNNREKRKAIEAKWDANHPGERKTHSQTYRKRHPETCRLRSAVAQARRKSRLHPDMDFGAETLMFRECQRLTKESGELHHIDHIIPIAAGGWHHHLNLQILPATINLRKNDDPFWEMDGYKSWRDVPEALWPERLKPSYRALQTCN